MASSWDLTLLVKPQDRGPRWEHHPKQRVLAFWDLKLQGKTLEQVCITRIRGLHKVEHHNLLAKTAHIGNISLRVLKCRVRSRKGGGIRPSPE